MKPTFSLSSSSVAAVKRRRAFSLLEVLAVLSIMLVLAGTSLLGLSGGSSAQSLDNAGNKVVDLINEARENAIARHVMTALVLVTPGSDPTSNADIDDRLFLIEQFDRTSSSWQPVSQWELLPSGVVVDPATSTTFMKLPVLVSPPTKVSYLGSAITPAAYQVFLPDGRLAGASQTPALRLVSARSSTPMTTTTSRSTRTPACPSSIVHEESANIAKSLYPGGSRPRPRCDLVLPDHPDGTFRRGTALQQAVWRRYPPGHSDVERGQRTSGHERVRACRIAPVGADALHDLLRRRGPGHHAVLRLLYLQHRAEPRACGIARAGQSAVVRLVFTYPNVAPAPHTNIAYVFLPPS